MSTLPTLKVVVGPTASGKSSYAIEWAKRIGGEIVNADSRQLYRDVSIGVAKPVFERVENGIGYVEDVLHHLFFALSPDQRSSVVDYQCRSFEVIDGILARGKTPILVGGTGYYVQAIVDNMRYENVDIANDVDLVSRMSLFDMLAELHERDALAFERVDRANYRRVANALVRARRGLDDVRSDSSRYEVEMVGLRVSLQQLEQRIIVRVDDMLLHGLVDEVRGLLERYGSDVPIFNSIGYKEVLSMLNGEITHEEMRELIIVHTRQYARRQMQWFKRDERIRWVEMT